MSHTDSRDTEFNFDLSQKRAQSVIQYLIEKELNLTGFLQGYGESSPKVVDSDIAHSGIPENGTTLSETFINTLANEEQKRLLTR